MKKRNRIVSFALAVMMLASAVVPSITASATKSLAPDESSGAEKFVVINCSSTGTVSIRTGAGTSNGLVKNGGTYQGGSYAKKYDTFRFTGNAKKVSNVSWFEIQLDTNKTGWVSGEYAGVVKARWGGYLAIGPNGNGYKNGVAIRRNRTSTNGITTSYQQGVITARHVANMYYFDLDDMYNNGAGGFIDAAPSGHKSNVSGLSHKAGYLYADSKYSRASSAGTDFLVVNSQKVGGWVWYATNDANPWWVFKPSDAGQYDLALKTLTGNTATPATSIKATSRNAVQLKIASSMKDATISFRCYPTSKSNGYRGVTNEVIKDITNRTTSSVRSKFNSTPVYCKAYAYNPRTCSSFYCVDDPFSSDSSLGTNYSWISGLSIAVQKQ